MKRRINQSKLTLALTTEYQFVLPKSIFVYCCMKKTIVFIALLLLIIFELLRVYLIMTLPGSQRMNSIHLAYWLGSNQTFIRIALGLLLAYPLLQLLRHGTKKQKIVTLMLLVIYGVVAYLFNWKMEADKMFYQPKQVRMVPEENNRVGDDKLVIGVEIGGEARAYPIQQIGYHHQVRDTINDVHLMVTYCTVCRTGRVFSPVVNGRVESFRLVGMDHFNAMFEDASTKSWWRQSTGECIAGPLKGQQLAEVPSRQMALSAWKRAHPNTLILQPDSNYQEPINKMAAYEAGKSKSQLTKRDSLSWQAKSWVLGISTGKVARCYDWNELLLYKQISDSLPGLPLIIVIENDSTSFHAYENMLGEKSLQLIREENGIRDAASGTLWNWDGVGVSGTLQSTSLQRIPCYQEYLHSWEYFHPLSKRYSVKDNKSRNSN